MSISLFATILLATHPNCATRMLRGPLDSLGALRIGMHATDATQTSSAPTTARSLRDVWLRFHEEELCQGVDATFVFNEKGMEVWCVVEDEKSYEKFLEMLQPLRSSYEVYLYATRPVAEKKSPEDKDPPPSLWNNAEIRDYFQEAYSKTNGGGGSTVRAPGRSEGDSEFFLKQRILMFAGQTLEWDNKLKRYAIDLSDLAEAAFGKEADPKLKARAATTCLKHAHDMDKLAERLTENLSRALPKATKRLRAPFEPAKSGPAPSPPDQGAMRLSTAAQSIARRIYYFIHPQNHTVGLVDLREPSLLQSLQTLRRMVEDFERAVRKAR